MNSGKTIKTAGTKEERLKHRRPHKQLNFKKPDVTGKWVKKTSQRKKKL